MTSDNAFSSDAALGVGDLLGTGVDLLRRGLTPTSSLALVRHVIRERTDSRYASARPMMQVVPAFDLYWRLHRQVRPHLSIFFTNHVASMMHRYWGHAVPEYAGEYGLAVDDIYAKFVLDAMRLSDRQLGILMDHVGNDPDRELVVASSMGQGPIEDDLRGQQLLVLEDAGKLGRAMGFASAQKHLAMYPACSIEVSDADEARALHGVLDDLSDFGGARVFGEFGVNGASVTFKMRMRADGAELDPVLVHGATGRRIPFADAGIEVKERLGGGNTAYHVPEGTLIRWRPGVASEQDRREVDVLDVAPSMLANVWGLQPAAEMEGRVLPDLFA